MPSDPRFSLTTCTTPSKLTEKPIRKPPTAKSRHQNLNPSRAGDVRLEVPDRPFLLRDHRVHQVTDRHNAHHRPSLHHRKMPYVVIRDDAHALAHSILSRHRNHR